MWPLADHQALRPCAPPLLPHAPDKGSSEVTVVRRVQHPQLSMPYEEGIGYSNGLSMDEVKTFVPLMAHGHAEFIAVVEGKVGGEINSQTI